MTQRSINLFLQRLKELRKKAGLTQQDIADRLGLNQATYSAMERGSQSILSDYLFKIAEILRIPIWQMFVDQQGVEFFKEDQNFFDMWKQFTSVERNILKSMAEQIMQKKLLERHESPLVMTEILSASVDS